MKFTILTEKRYRIVSARYGLYGSPLFTEEFPGIEGKKLKELINSLLTDPTYLDILVETDNPKFCIYEYEVGKIPITSREYFLCEKSDEQVKAEEHELKNLLSLAKEHKMNTIVKKYEHAVDKQIPIYFNQKILFNVEETWELIKKHRGYKNYMKLRAQVEKLRNKKAEDHVAEQERIRKENDVHTLARIMIKNPKTFKKIIKEAKKLEETFPPEIKLEFK